ncbi:hypothetical protein [Achromobacter sp. NFACC18-2]|uniref:hypothetical protein n=1 Tax=Achromobacter sp. NFACC18-2 TaxID=1564112 RepID=UPI001113C026|nr:hypothetical protein [Achromobacter sp. NFACC18-2]
MLFPENPEKCPTLWDAIAKQLRQEAMCFVITEGYGNPRAEAQRPTDDLAQQVITRLQQSQLCRISASRGAAVSPHFAGMRDGASVFITDFLSAPFVGMQVIQPDQLQRNLEVAVVNLLFAESGVSRVVIPLHLTPWAMRDAKVHPTAGGLVFTKRA